MNTYKVTLHICGRLYNIDNIDDDQCVCDTAMCADYGDLDLVSFERHKDYIYVVTCYHMNIDANNDAEARYIAECIVTKQLDIGSLYCGDLEDANIFKGI